MNRITRFFLALSLILAAPAFAAPSASLRAGVIPSLSPSASLSIVFSALGLPWLGLAVVPGALTPKPLSGLLSIAFAAILMIGYLFLMPNIFWAIGAVALLINGIVKLKNKTA